MSYYRPDPSQVKRVCDIIWSPITWYVLDYCKLVFMEQLKVISYFNIYKNIVRSLLKFITTLYQIKIFPHRLFLRLVFYTQVFV